MHAASEISSGPAVHFATALLPDGWADGVRLTFADGRIATIERDSPPSDGDNRGGVALPGMPNLHSHAFQRGLSGLAETRGPAADNFWTWREVMYRFLDRMTPDDLEAITAQAFVEMLEGGFTRVGEFHYVHHDVDGSPYANPAELAERVCAAAAATGIGLTLLPVFYAHGGFGGAPPAAGQRRFITSLDAFAELLQKSAEAIRGLASANLGVAPHSLRAVTSDELAAVIEIGRGRPIHVHAAEQVGEVEQCLAANGCRPIQWLLDHAPLNARWCLIHATQIDPSEIRALAATGATVGLCPVTEANLGDGIFPATEWLAGGGHFGVGTDSNVRIGVAEELRALEYSQRLGQRLRNALAIDTGASTGRSLYERALPGGQRALGVEAGGLVVGAPADIAELDCAGDLAPRERGDAVLDRFVFGSNRDARINRVWVGGRQVVTDGCHVAAGPIHEKYRRTLRRLLDS